MSSNSIVDPNYYNKDIWKKYFEYGQIYFEKGYLRFYDFSFVMIRQLGNNVIPMLKSIYLNLVNAPENADQFNFSTQYKDVKKMDSSIFKHLVPFSTHLSQAITNSTNLPIPLTGLDKEYFIQDCLADNIKNLDELREMLSILTDDLLDRMVYLSYLDSMKENNSNEGNNNLTEFEQLCLSVYSNEVALYPMWRNMLSKPAQSAQKLLIAEELNIIEYTNNYRDDLPSIINDHTIAFLRKFKSRRLDKLKGLI